MVLMPQDSPIQANRVLGVLLSPSNLPSPQYAVALGHARSLILHIKKGYLNPGEVDIAYNVFFLPKLLYPLGTQPLTCQLCNCLDQLMAPSLLLTWKFPSTSHRLVAFSSMMLAGSGLCP